MDYVLLVHVVDCSQQLVNVPSDHFRLDFGELDKIGYGPYIDALRILLQNFKKVFVNILEDQIQLASSEVGSVMIHDGAYLWKASLR